MVGRLMVAESKLKVRGEARVVDAKPSRNYREIT